MGDCTGVLEGQQVAVDAVARLALGQQLRVRGHRRLQGLTTLQRCGALIAKHAGELTGLGRHRAQGFRATVLVLPTHKHTHSDHTISITPAPRNTERFLSFPHKEDVQTW